MTDLRIGINTLFLIPGEVGGTETYLRQTLLAMTKVAPEAVLVLFTNRENDAMFREELGGRGNIEFVKLDFSATNRFSRIIREQFELPGKVRWTGVDVLWSPGYTMPYRAYCPQVVTIPDMQYKSFPEDLTPLALFVTDRIVQMAARRSGRIIAISEFTREEIVKYTGAARDKIDVTPLAVDPAFGENLPAGKVRRRTAALTESERPYLLSVANSYPHKNLHTLVNAFRLLENTIPHNLVIVGKPRLGEKKLQEATSGLEAPGRVIRLSSVAPGDLITLYQGAGLFVFPSLYEGFGLPVLEAMAAGGAVLTSRRGSLPEVGGDRVSYCDVEDPADLARSMTNILSWTEADRGERLVRAVERAGSFSWERTARMTVAVLRKAISTD